MLNLQNERMFKRKVKIVLDGIVNKDIKYQDTDKVINKCLAIMLTRTGKLVCINIKSNRIFYETIIYEHSKYVVVPSNFPIAEFHTTDKALITARFIAGCIYDGNEIKYLDDIDYAYAVDNYAFLEKEKLKQTIPVA